MPELSFRVVEARAEPHAATPGLSLVVEVKSDGPVSALLLQAQVRIDAPQRLYTAEEQAALSELFGAPDRWNRTLNGLLWANSSIFCRPFTERTEVELPLPVTFDASLAAAKYFEGVEGEVPLTVLFSGTIFHPSADGALNASLLPWKSSAGFRFASSLWKRTLEHHFPGRAAVSIDRALYEQLRGYQRDRGLTSVDQALARLLGEAR
jgi:hypothetical protein